MAYVWCGPGHFLVGGINYCISASCRKKVPNVCVEYTVFYQMINNIQGDRQVSSEQARMIYKTSAVVKKKLFVRSSMKVRLHSSMAVRETSRPI